MNKFKKSKPKKIRTTVLGGGLAGLASAALAAKRGEEVTLLERETWGGKSRRLELLGQRIDTGPALHSFPSVWNTLWQRLERPDPLQHLPASSLGIHHFKGHSLELPPLPDHPLFAAWQSYAARQSTLELETLLITPPQLSNSRFLRASRSLLHEYGFNLGARGYLESLKLPPLLLECLAIHALNGGLGSRSAPALYASLPALMLEQGLSIPHGGIYELVLALERICRELGVHLHDHRKVTQVQQGRVWIEDFPLEHDVVISAIDHRRLQMLQGKTVSAPKQRTCSGVAIYAVLDTPLELPLLSVLIPDVPTQLERDLLVLQEPRQTMIFVNHYPPQHIYPSNTRAVLSVLLTAPANGHNYALESDWVRGQLEWASGVLGLDLMAILAGCLGHTVLHPQYFAEGGAWGGAIYGDVRSSWQAGPLHQPPHHLARGMWQVGTSVHPGGGIPGVLGSALMVDEMIRSNG